MKQSSEWPAKWPLDRKALDERAEHDPLGEGAEGRAVAEGVVPEGAMLGVAEPELEGDAAEDERQQHDQKREIDRRQDDGEGEREGREQRHAAEHEPGLVAVPHRRNRVHHQIARLAVGSEAVEDADAEVEAVEQHVEKDADAEDEGPDRHEIENIGAHLRSPIRQAAWRERAISAARPR